MKSSMFWDITQHSPMKVNRLFSRTLLCCLIYSRPWRWRRHIPPKRRLTFNGLHGIVSQKIELFTKWAILWARVVFQYLPVPSWWRISSYGTQGFITVFTKAENISRACVEIVTFWLHFHICSMLMRKYLMEKGVGLERIWKSIFFGMPPLCM
jgi:hypothetical protein